MAQAHTMCTPAYRAFRLLCSHSDLVRGQYDVEHKAWLYNKDDFVSWELRRLVCAMYHEQKRVQPSKIIRQARPGLQEHFAALGLEWKDHMVPSASSMRYWEERSAGEGQAEQNDAMEGIDRDRVRSEFSASTKAMQALCLWWMLTKRKKGDKARACQLLLGIWQRCVRPADLHQLDIAACIEENIHLCEQKAEGDEQCHHVKIFKHTFDLAAPLTMTTLAEQVEQLVKFGFTSECPSCRTSLVGILSALATTVDQNIDSVGNADMDTWVEGSASLKRRRADEDRKVFLMQAKVQAGHASSSTACMSAHSVAPGTGRSWLHRNITDHIETWWDELGSKKLVGPYFTVEDGARFGNPALETMIYALWSGRTESAVWLPCQVLLAKEQTN